MTAPRAAIAWTFAGLVIGLIAVGAYERSTHQEPEIIPQPPGWVAFSSQIRYIDSIENTTRVGHFHRGDDGSTRSDTGPSLSNITSIGIKNFSKAEFYLWSKEKSWTQQPMDVPPWGLSVPWQATFNASMSRVPEKIEGFEVIKQTSRMRTMYRAPQLNLFTLTELQPCQWRTTELCGVWFHDVKVGPQDVDLFSPPAGAAIEVLTEPGGIVYRPSQP